MTAALILNAAWGSSLLSWFCFVCFHIFKQLFSALSLSAHVCRKLHGTLTYLTSLALTNELSNIIPLCFRNKISVSSVAGRRINPRLSCVCSSSWCRVLLDSVPQHMSEQGWLQVLIMLCRDGCRKVLGSRSSPTAFRGIRHTKVCSAQQPSGALTDGASAATVPLVVSTPDENLSIHSA